MIDTPPDPRANHGIPLCAGRRPGQRRPRPRSAYCFAPV